MANYFIYGNVNSADYGVMISGSGTFNKPQKRLEKISIPGRNGDVLFAEDGFENVTVSYPAFIAKGFACKYHDFIEAMLAQSGYNMLEDTYDLEHFRMAIFNAPEEAEVGTLNRTGKFTLDFDCQPQRWLKMSDEFEMLWQASDGSNKTFMNPTKFFARPILRVYGYGTISIEGRNNVTLTISNYHATYPNMDYIDIDSDIEECYNGTTMMNRYVSSVINNPQAFDRMSSYFPILASGENYLYVPQSSLSTISSIDYRARFWTI